MTCPSPLGGVDAFFGARADTSHNQYRPNPIKQAQAISRRRPLGGPSPASLCWQPQQQPQQQPRCCLSTIREVVKSREGLGQIPQERMRTMSIIAHIDHGMSFKCWNI